MPRLIPIRLVAACALAFALFISTAAVASAKKVEADLRVVAKGGKVLDEETLNTGPTKIPTSPKATCFGKGTGGSGKPASASGPTALGLLAQAATGTKALRPLLITDSFELRSGICGVGGYSATTKLSWYLKVNHKNPELGGESVKLKPGDEVLWALSSYPYPSELALEGPGEATPGVPFRSASSRTTTRASASRSRGDGDRGLRADRLEGRRHGDARRADPAAGHPRQGHPLQRRQRLHVERLPLRQVPLSTSRFTAVAIALLLAALAAAGCGLGPGEGRRATSASP